MFLEIWQNSLENTFARVFFNKIAGLRTATSLKKRLWHRCFPVNFVKFLRTPFYKGPLDDCIWRSQRYCKLHCLTQPIFYANCKQHPADTVTIQIATNSLKQHNTPLNVGNRDTQSMLLAFLCLLFQLCLTSESKHVFAW